MGWRHRDQRGTETEFRDRPQAAFRSLYRQCRYIGQCVRQRHRRRTSLFVRYRRIPSRRDAAFHQRAHAGRTYADQCLPQCQMAYRRDFARCRCRVHERSIRHVWRTVGSHGACSRGGGAERTCQDRCWYAQGRPPVARWYVCDACGRFDRLRTHRFRRHFAPRDKRISLA